MGILITQKRIYTNMSEDTPWYVAHSKEPKGPYGAGIIKNQAESNPENRRGVMLNHHNKYYSKDIQESILQGLKILKEDENRVVMIGGDWPSGKREYHHIKWVPEESIYKIIKEGSNNRHTSRRLTDIEDLNNTFPKESNVCVLLIYIKNSPFNLPEKTNNNVHTVLKA